MKFASTSRLLAYSVASLLCTAAGAAEIALAADKYPDQPQRLALVNPQVTRHLEGVPGDEELKTRHARIGRIDVQVDDVFETREPLSAPYRLANDLHISTHTQTIASQLLFHTGDSFSRQTLDETERLLRGRRYLNDATIEPVRYNADNTVDVVVKVHDVWTLSPGLSFGRKGGANSTRLEFEDTNFLGLGKQVSLSRSSNVDRTSWKLLYKDPNLFGSWWNLTTSYANLSDGGEKIVQLARPFYSLDSRWSFDVGGSDTANDMSEYVQGHVADRFHMQERSFSIGGGISNGLHDGWATRYLAGMRYEGRDFESVPGVTYGALPQDRVHVYPWVGVEVVQDQFLKTRDLDQVGRTEDLYLGNSARVELGYAATAFGSTDIAFMLRGALQTGAELTKSQYVVGALDFKGRMENGEMRNALADLSARYYYRQSPQRVFFASASTSFAKRLDPEQQLLLGGDNGLRGYPLRYLAGTANSLITLEERFYSSWQPLKLVNVGAAVFFDAGRSWGPDRYADDTALTSDARFDRGAAGGWLKDVGVGLRLGSARSGLGNVVHIDVAFPLDGGRDINSMQFLVETKRSF